MTNKLSISSSDDDFGFTFADETQITETVVQQTETLNERLQLMYDSIIPLLKNLNSNPDQEYIKWPNRTEKIKKFKNKLDTIGGDFIKTKSL